jgi:hypothetical protein
MNRKQPAIYFSVILLVIFSAGCTMLPKRVVNRTLTPEEAAIPAGRYQDGIDMHHTCQVDYDPPSAELVLESKSQYSLGSHTDVTGTWFTQLFADPNGGMIFTKMEIDENSASNYRVGHMQLDGTEDWFLTILPSGSGNELPDESIPDGTVIKNHTKFPIVQIVCITSGAFIVSAQY